MARTKDPRTMLADGLQSKRIRITYNYCGVCGRRPGEHEEPNYAPLRWWDPDDGWKIGSLCACCFSMVHKDKPEPGDYAYQGTNGVCDHENTDEDSALALA